MSWTPEVFNPIATDCGRTECRYFVAWLFSNECHAGCPYCMVGPGPTKYYPRTWSDTQAIFAWRQFHDDHGPALILFGGYEPSLRLPLLGEVIKQHQGIMVTNFTFDEQVLYRTCDPQRLIVHPSFHARLWDMDIDRFLAKIMRLRQHGYQVPCVSIACWPADFDKIQGWRDAVVSAGIAPNVHPLFGTYYQGRLLPDGYTDEEKQLMAGWMHSCIYEDKIDRPVLKLTACAAGHAAGGIMGNGMFTRCVQIEDPPLANFMAGEHVRFWDDPRPCPAEHCMCGNMGGYHIMEEV